MKNSLFFFFMLVSTLSIAQVPSVNINKTRTLSYEISNDKNKEFKNFEKKLNQQVKDKIINEDVKKKKQDSIAKIKEEDLKKSFEYTLNSKYYKQKIDKLDEKIKKLKKEATDDNDLEDRTKINSYLNELDALEKEKKELTVEQDRVLNPRKNNYNWWLPSRNPKYRNAFFLDTYNNKANNPNYLNSFAIVGSPNGVTGQSEIITDNIKWVRITFGTVITAINDSLTTENTRIAALQRLINGGGNFYFDFTLPLATTIKGNDKDELINFYTFANVKLASDIKGFGNNIDASTYNSSVGLNLYSDISSENKKFNFFIIGTSNYYYGCTKEFYKNLGIEHTSGFLSGKITLGVTLLNQFRLSADVLTYGSESSLRNNTITFGLQFLPVNKSK